MHNIATAPAFCSFLLDAFTIEIRSSIERALGWSFVNDVMSFTFACAADSAFFSALSWSDLTFKVLDYQMRRN